MAADPLSQDRQPARRGTRRVDRAAACRAHENRGDGLKVAGVTPRDPYSIAVGNEAARISARVEKRLQELERRPQAEAGNSAEFTRAANRLCELRPVRIGLTNALKRGKHAYVTTV